MKLSRKVVVLALALAAVTTGTAAAWAQSGPESAPARQQPTPQPAQPRPASPIRPASVLADSTENTYVPITPCRAVDTRVSGGPLAAGATRNFWLLTSDAAHDMSFQGGPQAGCNVPLTYDATVAVATNLTAVSPGGTGDLKAWTFNTAQPQMSVLSYTNQVPAIANSATLVPNASQSYDITVSAEAAGTDVTIDIVGYYVRPMKAVVNGDGTLYRGSRVVSAKYVNEAIGGYLVDFDRDISICTYSVTSQNAAYLVVAKSAVSSDSDPKGVLVYFLKDGDPRGQGTAFTLSVTC
ncbi:MAG TPA: hypothetical protein VE074_10790 [Jatrophihabitantaceae bacterium]|nr:hypothetical protein [Jatrophihabitantaceae bacterium]